MKTIMFTILMLLPPAAFSQEVKFGVEKAATSIREKTRAIYEQKGKTSFFLAKKSYGSKSICGTEITAYSFENEINRIIANSCFNEGRRAVEYFFDEGKPIFIFDVKEYFAESTVSKQWRNFKGIGSRESRIYLVDEKVVFHKHRGTIVKAGERFKRRIKEARAILKSVVSMRRKSASYANRVEN